jgi:hypothetical protein
VFDRTRVLVGWRERKTPATLTRPGVRPTRRTRADMNQRTTCRRLVCERPPEIRDWCSECFPLMVQVGLVDPLPGELAYGSVRPRPYASRSAVGRGAPPSARFWSKVDTSGDCWLWSAVTDRSGYGMFTVSGRKILAHRFVWELTHGAPPPPNLLVCHTCDVPPCVRPEHLFLGTHTDNTRDMIRKGRAHYQKVAAGKVVPRDP